MTSAASKGKLPGCAELPQTMHLAVGSSFAGPARGRGFSPPLPPLSSQALDFW